MLDQLPAKRAPSCISDLRLDEYLAGELEAGESRQLEGHLKSCARCQQREQGRRRNARDFLTRSPTLQPAARPASTGPRMQSQRRGVVVKLKPWGASALTLAAAAGLLLLLKPLLEGERAIHDLDPGGDLLETESSAAGGALSSTQTRTKGTPRLGFLVKRGENVSVGQPGARLSAGDLLRFTVSAPEARYVTVLGREQSGAVSVYYPAGANAQRIPAGRETVLDSSVRLDGSVGQERLLGVFCDRAVEVAELRRRVSAGEPPPSGCFVDATEVFKEPAP